MKKLYLVRHAKSSWSEPSLSDRQRPLNGRGKKNAPDMACRFVETNTAVDLIVSSPANRAKTTATHLADAMDYPPEKIQTWDELYFNGISSQLELIQTMDSSIRSLMLVGHNPDMTSLLNALCGYQVSNMPTCAIASIEFAGEWFEVAWENGALTDYDYPKRVKG